MAQQSDFKIMTDEHIPKAVAEQLQKCGVDAIRLIDHLDEGTPDPDVLEYCHQQGYTLVTADENIAIHVNSRVRSGN